MSNALKTSPDLRLKPADLIERLQRALSESFMLSLLRDNWILPKRTGHHIEAINIQRLHRLGATGFVIEYDCLLEKNGIPSRQKAFGHLPPGNARMLYEDCLISLQKNRRRQLTKSDTEGKFEFIPDLDMILRLPGLDEKIEGMALVNDAGRLCAVAPMTLQNILTKVTGSHLRAHRLWKRSVVRLYLDSSHSDSEGTSLIVKFYKRYSANRTRSETITRALHQGTFGRSEKIAVPEIIGNLPGWNALVMEDIKGVPLSDLTGAEQVSGMFMAGQALSKLHQSPFRTEQEFGVDNEISLLTGWSDLVGQVFPDDAKNFDNAMHHACALINHYRDYVPTLIHRDFHEKQLLVNGDRANLIDFDTTCVGNPAQDVGNMLAHLTMRELQFDQDQRENVAAFLNGYESIGKLPDDADSDAHLKSTLFRLACIYRFTTDWRHLAPSLIRKM